MTQCCGLLYQNPVWRSTGKESADAEENGRHVDRDHNRPTVLSAAGETYRWEKVKMTPSSNWSVLDGMCVFSLFSTVSWSSLRNKHVFFFLTERPQRWYPCWRGTAAVKPLTSPGRPETCWEETASQTSTTSSATSWTWRLSTHTKVRRRREKQFKMIEGYHCAIVRWVAPIWCLLSPPPGTHDIHALILGRAITGLQSFTVDK